MGDSLTLRYFIDDKRKGKNHFRDAKILIPILSLFKKNKLVKKQNKKLLKIRPTSALKDHPPFAPGVPAQVGKQRRPPGLSAECACLPRL